MSFNMGIVNKILITLLAVTSIVVMIKFLTTDGYGLGVGLIINLIVEAVLAIGAWFVKEK